MKNQSGTNTWFGMHGWSNNDHRGQAFLSKLNYQLLFFLIFVTGSLIRIYRIDEQFVIDDEWHALNAVQDHGFAWIFTHFSKANGADYSIPLALLYEFQYQFTGLNEILMRWPMLLTGCIGLLVLPYLLRPWLSKPERLLLAALLAISPFLIFFSRIARPYSILAVTEPAALLMAWHWWNSNQLKHGVGWVLLATFSAWLNLPALIVVTAPFAWFGLLASRKVFQTGDSTDLKRLTVIGVVMLVLLSVLLGPALATQPETIITKAGQDSIDGGTLPWVLSLASGSGHIWAYTSLGLISFVGLGVLFQRDRGFAKYLSISSLLAVLILIMTGATAMMHGPVFLRYVIGLLPFYLSCAAIGLLYVTTYIVRLAGLPAWINKPVLLVALVTLVMAGPVPDWPLRYGQFVTHQNYHYHYNQSLNPYTQTMNSWYQVEPFYEEIAALHKAGEVLIVEAPWLMESYFNPLGLQQDVHHQRIRAGFINGVCAGPLYGELTTGQPGMKFHNFVYLQELLDGSQTADYLVLRRSGMKEEIRAIESDFDKCEQTVRAKFGEPWRESEFVLVFKISPE